MIKVGIIGANGYTGMELMRILSCHPNAEVIYASSRKAAGEPIASVYPSLFSAYKSMCYSDLSLSDAAMCDVVFVCLPHGESAGLCGELVDMGIRVIDLSADFRYDNIDLYESTYKICHPRKELCAEAVYGLPEFNREKIKGARLIGNPGCYVTASVLALKPLIDGGVIDKTRVIIDAKSGVSGAGRKADVGYNFNEVDGSFKAYNVGTHRHASEIEEKSGASVLFVPHLLPVKRGILATIYCDLTASYDMAVGTYSVYNGEPFVFFKGEQLPELKSAVGSNCCIIGAKHIPAANKLVVVSCIDNLIKGASGQAVQNMNIMFDLKETAGLDFPTFGL